MSVLMFAGQGSQKVGMGKALFKKYREFTSCADDILGYSIEELCLTDRNNRLSLTEWAQPAVFTVNALSYMNEMDSGMKSPDFILGHSLGEYNALVAAGVLDFETGLLLVKQRAELMARVKGGGMAAVMGIDCDKIKRILKHDLKDTLSIAAYNSPFQTVITGLFEEVTAAKDIFIKNGATAYIPLKVSGAFHSKYFLEIEEDWERLLHSVSWNPPKIPVISNLTAAPYAKDADYAEILSAHIVSPVRWRQSIEYLAGAGQTDFHEIGTSNILGKMVFDTLQSVETAQTKRPRFGFVKEYGRKPENLVELLKYRAAATPEENVFRFLTYPKAKNGEENTVEKSINYFHLDAYAKKVAAALQLCEEEKKSVLLMLDPGLSYIIAFFGCLYANCTVVPVYPPTSRANIEDLASMVESAKADIVISTQTVRNISDFSGSSLHNLKWLLIEALLSKDEGSYAEVPIDTDSYAFVQYTSGSTSQPKGVMITHRQLIANLQMIENVTGLNQASIEASWLPPYHDMGLITGILQPVYTGFRAVLMSPESFLRKPERWLRAISEYKAEFCGAPNFAYELCSSRVSAQKCLGLDLSCWTLAFNGAEPIRDETMTRFADAFAGCGFDKNAFLPCYGLAENTLLVSVNITDQRRMKLLVNAEKLRQNQIVPLTDGDGSCELISCGTVPKEQHVEIVNPDSFEPCSPDTVGEIWIKGPSVAAGYFGLEALTKERFQARMRNGDGPYLRTGDLGFFFENHLFLTGRLKDLIIINGKNYYPQDIETLVAKVDSRIAPGRVAAFPLELDGSEDFAVAAETAVASPMDYAALVSKISETISVHLKIGASRILLVKPHTLPVTVSGKLRRKQCAQMYAQHAFETLFEWTPDKPLRQGDIQTTATKEKATAAFEDLSAATVWIRNQVAAALKVDAEHMDLDRPLGQYGLSSIIALELSERIEESLGITLSPTVFYNNPSIRAIVQEVMGQCPNDIPFSLCAADLCTFRQEDIAVVGAEGIFPGCVDKRQLWENLINGRSLITEVPKDRWDFRAEPSAADGNEESGDRWGGFSDDFLSFDAEFFNLSKTEAASMDPQQRKLLEVIWSSIEDAGYAPSKFPTHTGVFIGASSNDFQELFTESGKPFDGYAVTGTSHSLLANRISYLFNFNGPSETIDTACSSSLVAVHRAVLALRSGECDTAIVGGVNAIFSPGKSRALKNAGFLSADGRCKTFDQSANGYVRGEGCMAVVLKPLKDAMRDHDDVYTVIKGSSENHGGRATSLTAPNAGAQADLIYRAYKSADIDPASLRYVEVHGTGTFLGDPIEMEGLEKAYRRLYVEKYKADPPKACCGVGSVKTNIGHLESAAGLAGLFKVLLSFRHGIIPASVNLERINPYIHFDDSPFYIVREPAAWALSDDFRLHTDLPVTVGVSSFGFGGTNCHVVLQAEDSLTKTDKEHASGGRQIMVFSAKTRDRLLCQLRQFHDALQFDMQNRISVRAEEIAYTLQLGRDEFLERAAFVVSDVTELLQKIERFLSDQPADGTFSGCAVAGDMLCAPPSSELSKIENPEETAQSWIAGMPVDWKQLHQNSDVRRCHLPGSAFQKIRYALPCPKKSAKERVIGGHSSLQTDRAKGLNEAFLRAFLAEEVAKRQPVPMDHIDENIPMYDLGMNSVGIISIHASITQLTGRTVPAEAVYRYPSIASLAHYIVTGRQEKGIDLFGEVTLPDDIMPQSTHAQISGAIFLTGATGFVGGNLLASLLRNTDAEIYCLIRAKNAGEGMQRIRNTLKEHGIDDAPGLEKRVVVVPGDLAKGKLGIEEHLYEKLVQCVDEVYHCAATVDWMKPYEVLKEINVNGTVEVIRFACKEKTKHLHFISSLAVVPLQETNTKNNDNIWKEELVKNPEGITSGYGQSKWVCEQILDLAMQRGLPVTIYRFDFAIGSCKNGVMKDTDFIIRMIKGSIQIESMPVEEVYFNCIAADYLCDMIVAISLDRDNLNRVFHILNTKPLAGSYFAKMIEKYGYNLSEIPLELWKSLIYSSHDNALYPLYPFIKQYDLKRFSQYRSWRISRENTKQIFEKIDPAMYLNIPSPFDNIQKVMAYLLKNGLVRRANSTDTFNSNLFYWDTSEDKNADANMTLGQERQYADEIISIPVDRDMRARLEGLCTRSQLKEFDVLLSITEILAARYKLDSKIKVVVPVLENSTGNHPDEKRFNMLLVPADLSGGTAFERFARQVRCSAVTQYVNRETGDELQILTRTEENRNQILHPFAMYYTVNHHDREDEKHRQEKFPEQHSSVYTDPLQTCNIDDTSIDANLTFGFTSKAGALELRMKYDRSIFSKDTIGKIGGQFCNILTDVIHDPDTPIFFLQKRVI